jgi:hypothetical protein
VWLIALAGLAWLWLRRGARRPQPVVDIPPAGDPAGELRRKLDETKERGAAPVAESAAPPEPEATAAAEPTVEEDLDAKRRAVHERARAASDEMRGTSSD